MDYTAYRETIKNRISIVMNEESVSETDAFFCVAVNCLQEYGVVESVEKVLMEEDVKAGSKLIHIDGYSFDETDHSVSLFINDYDDSANPSSLNTQMVDRLYWRLFYFLETACSPEPGKYLDKSSVAYMAAILIRNRMNCVMTEPERILKIHLVIISNRELDTKLFSKDFFETDQNKSRKKSSPKSRKKSNVRNFLGGL